MRRLDDGAGFADAANEALHTVEGATFLLVCHDDVVLDPPRCGSSSRRGTAPTPASSGRSSSRADNPEILLEVGRSIDRFGAPYTGIEPGEVDQEQHDGVRDVFYVTTAVMLVRTDLFTALQGFDPETFPGAEDLDLCWRARLAGARVLVVPDARATHREAATDRLRDDRPDEFALARSRVRCSSPRTRCTSCCGWCPSASSWGSWRRSATCSPATRAGPAPRSAAGSRTCCT